MPALVRKDMPYFLWFTPLVLTIVAAVWLTDVVDNDVFRAGITCALSLFVSFVPVLSLEQHEEKSAGYRFMRTLPAGNGRVVAAKAVLPAATTALYLSLALGLAGARIADPAGLAIARGAIAGMATAALVVVGLSYICIFLLGYTRFAVLLGVLLFLAGVMNGVFLAAHENDATQTVQRLIDVLRTLRPEIVVPAGAALFACCMLLASLFSKYEKG